MVKSDEKAPRLHLCPEAAHLQTQPVADLSVVRLRASLEAKRTKPMTELVQPAQKVLINFDDIRPSLCRDLINVLKRELDMRENVGNESNDWEQHVAEMLHQLLSFEKTL